MFDVTERVRTGLYLLDSDNVNSLTSPPLHSECLLATGDACLFSEMDERLIELVCKCEELCYDMSVMNYSDSVWREKLWCQIGEEMKKIRQISMFFIAHFEITIILLAQKFQ